MRNNAMKIFSNLLVLCMLMVYLPISIHAATFDVTIRVYDGSTNRLIDNVAKTSISYDPSSEIVQSDSWQIPELSEFTDNSYGRVEQVTGNWYFPKAQASVGASVNWSINTGTKAITYHVTAWNPGTGEGSGSTATNTESVGAGSRYTWKQTIAYHSNYPDGTDYVQTFNYNVSSFSAVASGNSYKTLTQLGFTVPDGYEQGNPNTNGTYPWNTKADGTGDDHNKNLTFYQSDANTTLHLYAQWVPVGTKDVEMVKLTSKDGNDTYAEQTYFTGDTATTIDCDINKDSQDFEGWDTDESADTVIYNPGSGFTINENTTVWAVWSTRQVEDTIVLSYDANGGENAPEGEDSGVAEGSDATFIITDGVPTLSGFEFKGWSIVKNSNVVDYEAGDEATFTEDTILYAVWEAEVVDTVELIYNANGGTDAPPIEDSEVPVGGLAEFEVSDKIPTKSNYTFLGWADNESATTPDYEIGDIIETTVDKTIYAVWKENIDNTTKISEPSMDKKADGTDSIGEVEVEDTIIFTLNSHVGEDIADSVSYDGTTYSGAYDLLFKDTLSGPVTLDESNFVVTVDGTRLDDSQYSLDMSPSDGSTFNLTIDVVDLINSGDFDYSRAGLAEVVVSYMVTVDENAEDGDEIRNDASVNDSVVDTVTGTVNNQNDQGPGTVEPPATGSSSALIYTLIGGLLLSTSGVLFIVSKKRKI